MTLLVDLIVSFGKIGFVALGGGHSMLKLIEFETVTNRGWLLEHEFTELLGSTFLFPGLTAVKIAAVVGYKVAGGLGLMLAVVALNLPGILLATVGYKLLTASESPYIKKILVAVQYGALAMLAAASYSIAEAVLRQHFSPYLVGLTILFFIALAYFDISPFWGLIAFIVIAFFLVA